jgi:hypothetical protein
MPARRQQARSARRPCRADCPGGSEQYYYSLSSPVDAAVRAGEAGTQSRPIGASADVGPDLILAWRRPSLVILYAKHATEPSALGLTQAQGRYDANVIMRTPQDRSVFPAPALMVQVQARAVPLADLLQQIWDLQDLGGADRIEAAGRLRQWLLERPLPGLRSVPPRLPSRWNCAASTAHILGPT